jgi:sulfonate dioxygenase
MSTTTAISKGAAVVYDINVPYNYDSRQSFATKYPQYLPTFDNIWFEPLPPFDFEDPALRADPSKPNFLKKSVEIRHITPRMGSIVDGVQLTTLSDAAKDELALLICERKVLAFPDQDFIDAGPQFQQDFMKYFGKPNYQPVSGTLPGYPGFHIIHREGNKEEIDNFLEKHQSTCLWHQDVSYERQPPGYVALGMLHGPVVGGDTVFAATDMAYK